MKYHISAVTLFLMLSGEGSSAAKTIDIPLKHKRLETPLTRSQKMLSDFHHLRLNERYSNMFIGAPSVETIEKEEEEKFRLQQSIELLNNSNLAYVGPVYFGTPLQTD